MKYILLGSLTIAVLWCFSGCHAYASDYQSLALEITNANPQIKALSGDIDADMLGLQADNAVDNPEIEAERLWKVAPGENRWSVGVSQSFRWPGFYSASGKAVEATRMARMAELKRLRIELWCRAAQALVSYAEADVKCEMLHEADSLLDKFSNITAEAFRQGEVTIMDVNRASVQAAAAHADYLEALEELVALRGELEAIGYNPRVMSPLSQLEWKDPSVLLPDSAYLCAIESSPAVAVASLDARADDADWKVARFSRYPGFSIGYRHAYEDGNHFNGISIGVELPLWRSGKDVAAANARRLAGGFRLQSVISEVRAKVRTHLNACRNLERRIATLSPAVENTDNARFLRKAYEGGQISVFEFLNQSEYFLQARLRLLSLRTEYLRRRISLSSLVPLDSAITLSL